MGKFFLILTYLIGAGIFFFTTLIFGYSVNHDLSFLPFPFLYFIASALCWIPVFFWLKNRKTEKVVVVEKPKIIEKPVEKKVYIKEEKEKKDYYVGSLKTKKYHRNECRWSTNINSENRIYFKKKSEAEERGYEECKTCKP